jgi:hypothetical protein
VGKSRDHSDLQDMYRHALAASWAAQTGELPADECIEDIFAGGDGWKDKFDPASSLPRTGKDPHEDGMSGDEQQQQRQSHSRAQSTSSSISQSTIKDAKRRGHGKERSRDIGIGRVTGIQSPQSTGTSSDDSERERQAGRDGLRSAREVDEFDVREDLIAWRVPGKAAA